MKRRVLLWMLASCLCVGAYGQGVIGDVLGGRLIKPKLGQWAWYDVRDAGGNTVCTLRQALVGNETVGNETGWWLEFEMAPKVGYTSVYKMLLTGPAGDPKNVHKILAREGPEPIQEIPVQAAKDPASEKDERKSLGMADVETPAGVIRAEHFAVTSGDRTIEIWINEDVYPIGVVRMVSPDGELLLRSFGVGGKDGESVLEAKPERRNVEVKVDVEEPAPTNEDAEHSPEAETDRAAKAEGQDRGMAKSENTQGDTE